MGKFKSPWYYWHTGHKRIALASMAASALVSWVFLFAVSGFSLFAVLVAVLLDSADVFLALAYLFLLRGCVLGFLHSTADALVFQSLAVPLMVGFFVSRVSSYWVARRLGYDFGPCQDTCRLAGGRCKKQGQGGAA